MMPVEVNVVYNLLNTTCSTLWREGGCWLREASSLKLNALAAHNQESHSKSVDTTDSILSSTASSIETGLDPEEDKRRRNTLASARFRSKKKRQEQGLHQSLKDKSIELAKLEIRLKKLELENKLLRELMNQKPNPWTTSRWLTASRLWMNHVNSQSSSRVPSCHYPTQSQIIISVYP